MQHPVQITFRSMPHSDALDAHARRRAEKLERFYDRITTCHVVIEAAHRHHRHGKRYRVSITIGVPRGELAVAVQGDADENLENAYAALDEAFEDAERRVEDWARRLREHDRAAARSVAINPDPALERQS